MKTNPVLFNPLLQGKASYKGGKTINDIALPEEIQLYKLSSNENPIGPSPKAIEALNKVLPNLHIYPDRTDIRFREKLRDFYGKTMSVDHFLCSNSGVALLEMISRAFLQEGNEIIISNPAFGPYEMFALKQGAKVIDIPLMEPDFSLDADGILDAITENTRLIYVTNPNNPTGTYIPQDDIDYLVEHLPDHVILVYDEVYFHFADAEDFSLAMPYVLADKNVIAVNSFAKSYGLAGLRMGYGYAKPEIMNYMRNIQRPFFINIAGMEAAMAALDDKEHISATVKMVQTQKEKIYSCLEQIGAKYWRSQSNFILIKPPVSESQFEQDMLQYGLMVRPVANFGAPGCIRISIGNDAATDALIKALNQVYAKYT